MRRWMAVLFLGITLGLGAAGPGLAQTPITLNKVEVDLWPEYDRPSMLVINHIFLETGATLPAALVYRIPASVGDPFNLAARNHQDGKLYTLPFTRVVRGDWSEVNFSTPSDEVQLEYYDPNLTKSGANRSFSYLWPGDHAAKTLILQVQQPVSASNLQISPSLGNGVLGEGSLLYYTAEVGSKSAGETFTLTLSYQKSNDTLSVQEGKIGPSAPVSAGTTGRVILDPVWWWGSGILALLLLAFGIWWYLRSSAQTRLGRVRRRHIPYREKPTQPTTGDTVYCHQCGKRALPGDFFCRSCGTKLRL